MFVTISSPLRSLTVNQDEKSAGPKKNATEEIRSLASAPRRCRWKRVNQLDHTLSL